MKLILTLLLSVSILGLLVLIISDFFQESLSGNMQIVLWSLVECKFVLLCLLNKEKFGLQC
jgi:hypothetical protein